MAIVDLRMIIIGDFPEFFVGLPEGKSHDIPLNHHKFPFNRSKIPLNPVKPP